MTAIRTLLPEDPRWPDLRRHLADAKQARWVLGDDGRPQADVHVLAALEGERVVGTLALHLRPLVVPETAWSKEEGHDPALAGADGLPLLETFVQAFFVEEEWRRRGIGRRLQQAALVLTRELGACQMRSWSSLDKPANHALKRSLGFALHPAVQTSWSGQPISGVYFVKRVDGG